MPKNKEEENPEVSGCKCPNCGASLMITAGVDDPEDEFSFSEKDEKGQREDMKKDFEKRTGGKLEEYS